MPVASSLNGWPVLFPGDKRIKTGTIPGTTRRLTLRADVLPLFLHFAAAWNDEMPDRLKLTDARNQVDSLEVRAARAADGYSDHASGTAVDFAYRVLLADHQLHMTSQERTILARILGRYVTADGHHVLANGYLWTPGKFADEMHTELSQGWDHANGAKRNTTAADVRSVIAKLGIHPDGTTAPTIGHVEVGGKTPVTAREIAAILGISWARVIRYNGRLAVSRAKPTSIVRVPPGVPVRPIYRGAPQA